jgi:hypothetical protein
LGVAPFHFHNIGRYSAYMGSSKNAGMIVCSISKSPASSITGVSPEAMLLPAASGSSGIWYIEAVQSPGCIS